MTVPYGYVQLESVNPPDTIVARLDSARPQAVGRVGGFAEVERRKRVATTEWAGHALDTMDVAIILDGWRDRIDQRATYDRLVAMGVQPAGAPAPPEVRITGNVPGTGRRWVVNGIAPGEAITGVNGELWRQFVVVQLLEWNPAQVLVRRSATTGKPAHYTLHTVRKGDTLAKLSVRYYGVASKARAIGQAQTPVIRDPRAAIRVGRVLRIP